MPDYLVTPPAREDLKDIGRHTQKVWGRAQRNSYLRDLDRVFSQLATDPTKGRDRSDLRPGLMAAPCNKHMVFFRRDPQGQVVILRILHQRMDFERRL